MHKGSTQQKTPVKQEKLLTSVAPNILHKKELDFDGQLV